MGRPSQFLIKPGNRLHSAAFAYALSGKLCRVAFKGPRDAKPVHVQAVDSIEESDPGWIDFGRNVFGPINATVSA
jgi:hypothetical protein